MVCVMWEQVTRSWIKQQLKILSTQIVNRSLPPQTITLIFRNRIKSIGLQVNVRTKYQTKFVKNTVAIGGEYCPNADAQGNNPITLCFVYNNPITKIKLNLSKFEWLLKRIADTLLHEIIHLHQQRNRLYIHSGNTYGYDSATEEQYYLSQHDEIDAYAFNLACWFVDKKLKTRAEVQRFLKNRNQSLHRIKINTEYDDYVSAFGQHHPILNQLVDQAIKYIPCAVKGRPYPPNQWEKFEHFFSVKI